MSKSDSTSSRFAHKPTKPNKPYPEFPLFPHAAGVWAKKIRGKMHYFGAWDDPDAALAKYTSEKDALHSGRTPRPDAAGVTVKALANAYLNHKQALLDSDQLSPRTFKNYKETAELLVAQFGKTRLVDDLRQDDFAALMATMTQKKKWGLVRVRNYVQQVRSVFKFGIDSGLLDRVVKFGPGFAGPKPVSLKKEKQKKERSGGKRLFDAAEVRALIDGALVVGATGPELVEPSVSLRAMVLLGINCGFGNSDCGTLPRSALDLAGGWHSYPRPKTGEERRCALWPETVEALLAVLAEGREPLDAADADLVFLTATGRSWAKDTSDAPISKEMRKLLDALGITGNKNYYALRHTFRTVADEAKDQPAADYIMGHKSPHMASVYRERISDARLKAVSDHVRAWVFEEKVPSALPKE